ncbi:MAG: GNAT family N-acetyltransferase [Anaerolineaceae bacterium]|nr:GNAT family N-acetyltransferase [Anaerolineaceae bacterium]
MPVSPLPSAEPLLADLGDGLVLRRSTPADAPALSRFNAQIHAEGSQPDDRVAAWTLDLLNGKHPSFSPHDFTLIEDTRRGQIVSAMNLISQVWTYAGVPFGVGRPELVGTHPDYRDRGLVRRQFEVIHAWSRARGEQLQAITGIPYFYRQFGYEMAVGLGGWRGGYATDLPTSAELRPGAYRLRPATARDLKDVARLYQQRCDASLLAVQYNEAQWHYELSGKSERHVNRRQLRIIENRSGRTVGFTAFSPFLQQGRIQLLAYELDAHQPWMEVTPYVIRDLWQAGTDIAARESVEFASFCFMLGEEHPAYVAAANRLPHVHAPYAWYLRLPDLPAFLGCIAPVLERRLAGSPAGGLHGDLRLNFYRAGLRLVFEHGRLRAAEDWRPAAWYEGDASFPGQTFLQLLFGYRTLEELEYAFPDCRYGERAWLLPILFPRQGSYLFPIS